MGKRRIIRRIWMRRNIRLLPIIRSHAHRPIRGGSGLPLPPLPRYAQVYLIEKLHCITALSIIRDTLHSRHPAVRPPKLPKMSCLPALLVSYWVMHASAAVCSTNQTNAATSHRQHQFRHVGLPRLPSLACTRSTWTLTVIVEATKLSESYLSTDWWPNQSYAVFV